MMMMLLLEDGRARPDILYGRGDVGTAAVTLLVAGKFTRPQSSLFWR